MRTTGKLSRRRFVGLFAFFPALSTLAHPRKTEAAVVAAAAVPSQEGGLLRLRLEDFPALLQRFGSVRLGTSAIGTDHFPAGLFYPVIITRGAADQFYAVDAACSHEGCTVLPWDPATQRIECPCHGSQYLIDGALQRGPAGFGLRRFLTRFDGANELAVELPDVSFALSVQVSPGEGRVQLTFIAFEHLEYEVRFRHTVLDSWSDPRPFALTPNGPADQLTVLGRAHYATIHLDAPEEAGMFAVASRLREV